MSTPFGSAINTSACAQVRAVEPEQCSAPCVRRLPQRLCPTILTEEQAAGSRPTYLGRTVTGCKECVWEVYWRDLRAYEAAEARVRLFLLLHASEFALQPKD
jgi:hypothetical protein